MNEIQKLLNANFPFVEDLLKQHGEFFPLACALKTDDTIAQIGTYDDDEKPLSNKVIADLKIALSAYKHEYKAIAIFFDVRVTKYGTDNKTDAVAVLVETINENTGYIFYYPYQLSEKQLAFSDSWKEKNEKEIFI